MNGTLPDLSSLPGIGDEFEHDGHKYECIGRMLTEPGVVRANGVSDSAQRNVKIRLWNN